MSNTPNANTCNLLLSVKDSNPSNGKAGISRQWTVVIGPNHQWLATTVTFTFLGAPGF